MAPTACQFHRMSIVRIFVIVSVICGVVRSHDVETADAGTRNTSDNNRADVLTTLLSALKHEKVHELLKGMPLELQLMVGQVMTNKMDLSDGRLSQLQNALLKAAKDKGLLDSWKEKLDGLIFEDKATLETEKNAQPRSTDCVGNECSLDKERGERHGDNRLEKDEHQLPGTEEVEANDVEYLKQTAQKVFKHVVPKETPPAPKMPQPSASAYDRPSQKLRGETKVPPAKTKEPLDALLGMAKTYLGQEQNDPTLDIVANMASAYLKSSSGSNTGGPDLNSLLQMASLFGGAAGGNGKKSAGGSPLESLASMLGDSGMDLNQLLQVGSALMGQGTMDRSSGKSTSVNKPRASSPIAELVIRTLAGALNLDPDFLVSYYNGLTKLMEANSWDEINHILRHNMGTDAEALLDSLANNEVRQQMSDTTTALVVDWMQEFLHPDSLKTRIIYVNAILMQYSYPSVDPNNIIETFSQVVERLSKEFIGTRIDLRPYLLQFDRQLKRVLKLDQDATIDFSNFTQEQLTEAVRHSMKSEVFDPLADLWSDFRLASRYPKCARTIVCFRNAPSLTHTPLGLKNGITRATSTVVVWALSKTNNRGMPPFNALYQAAMEGANGIDCEETYKENCGRILSEPLAMRLSYEHHEL